MLHRAKTNNLIIRRTPLFCGLLVAFVLALLPVSAGAQCSTGWDASGEWQIIQRGQPYPFSMKLEQKGKVITGAVRTVMVDEGLWRLDGRVDGTIEGNSFNIMIYWLNDATGVYNGRVMPSGRLDGEAYEKRSPNVRHIWHSEGVLKCAPPPPVTPKVIRSSGRKPTTAPSPPPAPPKPPFVFASQAVFQVPFAPMGFVVLTWDAGPDHPAAELWLKTSGGATTVAKHGKGGLQVPVERGRAYEYMVVTEAGKILAGATFVAR